MMSRGTCSTGDCVLLGGIEGAELNPVGREL